MKIIKIMWCVGCPSCEYREEDNKWYCRELQKYVIHHDIDEHCPLPDEKE